VFASLNSRAIGLTLSAVQTIELAAKAGFGGVDLLVRDVLERGDDVRALRARMEILGLRGGAWPLPVDWRGDWAEFRRDLERLPRYADAAAALGLFRTGTWVMPETPAAFAGLPDRQARRAATAALHVERLGAIAGVLARSGVRLGLEAIGVETSRGNGGDPFVYRLADLGDALGPLRGAAPNLGVVLDGFHLYAAGESIDAGLARGVDDVVWVHAADLPSGADAERSAMIDRERGLPGEHPAVGTRALLHRLAAVGYDGPVTAEPMAGCRSLAGLGPEETVRRTAAALRSVWPGSDLKTVRRT
jgi:sugar phosphate isomerase/epimerase